MRAAANSTPRISSSTQRTFWPVTTVANPSPRRSHTTWVGHGVPSSATRCTGPVPGTTTSTSPPRSVPVGFTTSVAPDGASTRPARSWSASRASASPIWRASW